MSGSELSSDPVELVVAPEQAGERLDAFLARAFPAHSRVSLRKTINAAAARVDGRRAKAAHRLKAGERVSVSLPEPPREGPRPEDIPLDVLYEDAWLAIINKPAGMVVHPARGHWSGTLASALAFHFQDLSSAGGPTRPGIVHRLDRDTSGVIVIAKDDQTHKLLCDQFEQRTVEKEYFAIVVGIPEHDRGLIDKPIGPHPYHREKMAIRRDHPASRDAQTHYEVVERLAGFAVIAARPKTGRTHQIRLHLASVGCHILCDRLYGGRSQLTLGELRRDPADATVLLARQALHARSLKLAHPRTGAPLASVAPLPADLERTLVALRELRPLGREH